MTETESTQRIDKWLWVARFFKTRGLAAQAVTGGKVQLEGNRIKPAKLVGPGSRLRIRKGTFEWDVVVNETSKQRRSAPEAQTLFEETDESIARRHLESARRREERTHRVSDMSRPDKKGRRALLRMKRT
jgi:ribosome-associated heat shock protein Hsp15